MLEYGLQFIDNTVNFFIEILEDAILNFVCNFYLCSFYWLQNQISY